MALRPAGPALGTDQRVAKVAGHAHPGPCFDPGHDVADQGQVPFRVWAGIGRPVGAAVASGDRRAAVRAGGPGEADLVATLAPPREAAKVVVGAVRAAATAKEDETDPAGSVEVEVCRALHGNPLEGVGPRRENGPLLEATARVVVEVAAGQVPAVASVKRAAVRGAGQGGPVVDQADGVVLGRPVRQGRGGARRAAATEVVGVLHAKVVVGGGEALAREDLVPAGFLVSADVEAAGAVGAGTATADRVAGLLEATGGAHQEADELLGDPLVPGAVAGGAVAADGVLAGGVDLLDRAGLLGVVRGVGATVLADHCFSETSRVGKAHAAKK